ncbi:MULTISPECIES: ATP-NAD kinase [Yersinia]|uniref:ATP-NAD kinase n=1 Tax=Yersinia massiliensis TaxID=419257 RepID=A0ABM6USW8_9GAMM|nr:ATP-NAD kinase [Yersinia massiliensis]AVX37792.1 ATP-NAD kinase [Yersinia massiliensis]
MSEPISDPTVLPEKAALQLVVELIRGDKVPMHSSGNMDNLLKMYDQAVQHFKKDKQ